MLSFFPLTLLGLICSSVVWHASQDGCLSVLVWLGSPLNVWLSSGAESSQLHTAMFFPVSPRCLWAPAQGRGRPPPDPAVAGDTTHGGHRKRLIDRFAKLGNMSSQGSVYLCWIVFCLSSDLAILSAFPPKLLSVHLSKDECCLTYCLLGGVQSNEFLPVKSRWVK